MTEEELSDIEVDDADNELSDDEEVINIDERRDCVDFPQYLI